MAVALLAKSLLRAVAGAPWEAVFVVLKMLQPELSIDFTGSNVRVGVFHMNVPLHTSLEFALVPCLVVGMLFARFLVLWGKRREPGTDRLDRDLLARDRFPAGCSVAFAWRLAIRISRCAVSLPC